MYQSLTVHSFPTCAETGLKIPQTKVACDIPRIPLLIVETSPFCMIYSVRIANAYRSRVPDKEYFSTCIHLAGVYIALSPIREFQESRPIQNERSEFLRVAGENCGSQEALSSGDIKNRAARAIINSLRQAPTRRLTRLRDTISICIDL